jgi:hypothetical protein
MTMKLASSPSRNPRSRPGAGIAQLVAGQHVVDGGVGFFSVMATTTPLPAARPSALMTIGAPCLST